MKIISSMPYDEKSVIEGWKEFQVFVKQRNNQYCQNVKKC